MLAPFPGGAPARTARYYSNAASLQAQAGAPFPCPSPPPPLARPSTLQLPARRPPHPPAPRSQPPCSTCSTLQHAPASKAFGEQMLCRSSRLMPSTARCTAAQRMQRRHGVRQGAARRRPVYKCGPEAKALPLPPGRQSTFCRYGHMRRACEGKLARRPYDTAAAWLFRAAGRRLRAGLWSGHTARAQAIRATSNGALAHFPTRGDPSRALPPPGRCAPQELAHTGRWEMRSLVGSGAQSAWSLDHTILGSCGERGWHVAGLVTVHPSMEEPGGVKATEQYC